MPANRISTSASAKAAKATTGRQIEYPDVAVGGLALRVTPAGRKTWTLRYRTRDGQQRRITLGTFPAVGLADARQAAREALGAAAKGADPAKQKQAAVAAAKARKLSTVGDLIDAYFEDAERGRHRMNARPKRASTIEMERAYFERLIRPRFGKVLVADLGRHDLQVFFDDVGGKAPSAARQCRNVIRQAFNYGVRREVVAANPAQLSELPVAGSRDRVLSDAELRLIWAATFDPRDGEGVALSAGMGRAIRFAMVTLQRGGEVCGLEAQEVDRQARLWTIPGGRTKNHRTHVVPLSPLALDVLHEAFGTQSWTGYAFPSPRREGPITRRAFSRATNRVTKAVGVGDATPHDFRRTGSTAITGERIGVPRFVVSRILNQMSDTGGAAAVTGVYDRNEYLTEGRGSGRLITVLPICVGRAAAIGRRQDNAGAPHVLLRRAPIRNDRLKPTAIVRRDRHNDPCSHFQSMSWFGRFGNCPNASVH